MNYLLDSILEEQLGFNPLHRQRIKYQNKTYRQARLFFTKKIAEAEKFCRECSAKDIQTLVVESKNRLFVWIEQIEEDKQMTAIESTGSFGTEPNSSVNSKTNSANAPVASTRKIIKKYRGATYEVEVPIYTATQSNISTRKYRGESY